MLVQRLLVAAVAALAARVLFLFVWRIDSDEPQHLHVAWGWSEGLVQYRDVFDNHLPLLHVLFAPVIALAPESSAVFPIMRLAIMPFAIGCAVLLYIVARPLVGTHTAAAAAILFSVLPTWLAKSVEFRNDTLWIFFWLAALALLRRSRLLGGVAMGLSLLASVKAVPLLLAHVLAGLAERRRVPMRAAGEFIAGLAAPVVITAAVFASLGALDDMIRQALLFNAAAPVAPARRIGGALLFIFGAAFLAVVRPRYEHLTLLAIWYLLVLLSFWPILTPRDYFPVAPALVLAVARRMRAAVVTPVLVTVAISIVEARLWQPRDTWRAQFVDAVVRVARPDDYVFDLKGDAVFRRRAVPMIYEDVGRALTERGVIPDRGPEAIAATRCCVAIKDSTHIPPRTRAYLNRHFVDIGPLRICRDRLAKEGT